MTNKARSPKATRREHYGRVLTSAAVWGNINVRCARMPDDEARVIDKASAGGDIPMMDGVQGSGDNTRYDLEERTARFGEAVIELTRALPKDPVNSPLISQVVRSGTSIGANYMEADGAESRKDFRHKISICRKESKETGHWLRMLAHANPGRRDECQRLLREAHELTLIFSSILLPKKP
jgi:four helix bundle protein